MTYRIVRKPILGKYYTVDFEMIKIKDTVPKNITPKEQQLMKNKLQIKKNSKKQDKNNKDNKNIESTKTSKNNSTVSKKNEYFIVGNFHIKKPVTHLYHRRLDNLRHIYDDDNHYEYDDSNNIETEYYFSEDSDTDSYDMYGEYDY